MVIELSLTRGKQGGEISCVRGRDRVDVTCGSWPEEGLVRWGKKSLRPA